jgi:uncharacterized glyoxalase superfamily protein PhnB
MLSNRSIPRRTVMPVLAYSDIGEAIAWLCDVFGFTLRLRIGDHRAQLNVGDGAVVLSGQRPTEGRDSHSVLVRVEDVDAHYQRALDRGARVTQAPTTHAFGERQYNVEDCAGHRWTFSQSVADTRPEDWGGTAYEL